MGSDYYWHPPARQDDRPDAEPEKEHVIVRTKVPLSSFKTEDLQAELRRREAAHDGPAKAAHAAAQRAGYYTARSFEQDAPLWRATAAAARAWEPSR